MRRLRARARSTATDRTGAISTDRLSVARDGAEAGCAPNVGRAQEIRRKAAAAALMVGGRSIAVRLIGMAGSIVLARLLTPADFGAVAIGNVVIGAGSTLTDGGLGAGLIRGPHAPDREDLSVVVGYQLVGAVVVVVVTGALSAAIGGHALITAVMVCALPILTFQTPCAIVLERQLEYKPMIVAEILQTVVYTVWAVIAVALFSAGVWGLATATVVSALIGTIAMTVFSRVGVVAPRLSAARIRRLLGFGLRFQAIDAVGLIRDQGLNSLTGAIGGIGVLGLWSLTYRLLQPGTLLFQTLRHVSYPGMARLKEAGENQAELVTRALAMTCIAASLVLAPMAACPRALVPAVFGERWAACADVVSMAALAMLVAGPLSVAAAGFLFAEGDAHASLRVVVSHTVVGLLVAAVLLPTAGINALGYCALAAAATDSVMFTRALRRHLHGLRPLRTLTIPIGVSTAAAAVGWWVTNRVGNDLAAALAGASVALAAVVSGHWLTDRRVLKGLSAVVWRAGRSAIPVRA